MRVLILLSFSCNICIFALSQNASSNGDTSQGQQGTYYCHAKCLASCLMNLHIADENHRATALEGPCSGICGIYKTSELCDQPAGSCKLTCNEFPGNATGTRVSSPQNLSVNYVLLPQPTPREAFVMWHRVQNALFYIIEYSEVVARRDAISAAHRFLKYMFRVAAITADGISPYSEFVVLPVPTPVVPTPSYIMISAERVSEVFPASPGDPFGTDWNTTVKIVVAFAPPPNWNLNTEITDIDAHVHTLDVGMERLSYSAEPRRIADSAQFEIRLPGAVADSFSYAKLMFTVEKMFTICDKENAVPYPPLVYNPQLNMTLPGLSIQINCQDIKNGGCAYNPKAYVPECGFKDVVTQIVHEDGADSADVMLTMLPNKNLFHHTVLWYNMTFGEGEKGSNIMETILVNLTKILNTTKLDNSTRNFTLSNLRVGKVYVVYICAVYDERYENIIGDFSKLQRFAVDLTDFDTKYDTSDTIKHIKFAAVVVVPILLAICILFVTLLVCVHKRNRQRKTMDELGVEYNLDDSEGRYVTLPRRFDHWEIHRRRLQIFHDQKLGSGAFGAVYKGRILGGLMKHKDSNSVLAEYWMQADNCEVAIKMLPSYADETSKSEFQNEINLMKHLGCHERLVNMLGCVTLDDPICLVVEYCSGGDLLHYLRDRRKYMLTLQEKGIDVNNVTNYDNLDFDLLLCNKDLISFAWQISVGLEYLSEKGYIHRDVAARNILVASGKRAKVGDFGLCRYSCSDPVYMSKGGRLPIKWMALEAIRSYEFTTKSDVWSYGVLLFEIVTLGGSPYPSVQPQDMEAFLESGQRMEQPETCPFEIYEVMLDCWKTEPKKRPTFSNLREGMRLMLEHITEDYYYVGMNQSRDYYNVAYQQDDEFVDPPPSLARQSTRSVTEEAETEPQSPGPSEAAFENDNVFMENSTLEQSSNPAHTVFDASDPTNKAEASDQNQLAIAATVPPPIPPRLTKSRRFSVDSATSSGEDSCCSSPNFVIASKRHDSCSSDQVLLSPAVMLDKNMTSSKFGFFKFTPSPKLTPLQESSKST